MVRLEVNRILEDMMREHDQVAIEILPAGAVSDDICELLADRKSSGELQTVIRENLYQMTVPCESWSNSVPSNFASIAPNCFDGHPTAAPWERIHRDPR